MQELDNTDAPTVLRVQHASVLATDLAQLADS